VVSRVALRQVVFVSRVEMDLDRGHLRIVMRDLAPHRSAIACALRVGSSGADSRGRLWWLVNLWGGPSVELGTFRRRGHPCESSLSSSQRR
jgi:hypothetical protein